MSIDDEVPEMSFADAILTQPGENLIEKVQAARQGQSKKMCVMVTLYIDTTLEEPELLRYVLDALKPEELGMEDEPVVLLSVIANGIEPTVETGLTVAERAL